MHTLHGRTLAALMFIGFFASGSTGSAQNANQHSRDSAHSRTSQKQTSRKGTRQKQTSQRRTTTQRAIWAPSACYKLGSTIDEVALDFVNTGFQWPQPNGLGSSITITYSYSNLLDGQLQGVTPDQARQAIENALLLWASVAPLDFVEIADTGPLPTVADDGYAAGITAQIRFGHHTIDGVNGGALAHAFLPFSDQEGLAGDLHLDVDEDWSSSLGGFFLETVLHELGHTLGLDHETAVDAIMNPFIANRFNGIGDGFLLADDVAGIRDIYGQGVGSVTTLVTTDDPDTDDGDNQPDETPGGVTASYDSVTQSLQITGDSQNNAVIVVPFLWSTAVLGFDGTTINDQPGEIFFGAKPSQVNCDLNGGNDQLWIWRLRASVLECDLGDGDDWLVMVFSSVGELIADGGNGSDLFLRIGSRFSNRLVVGFE